MPRKQPASRAIVSSRRHYSLPLVDADDADAVSVDIAPRENWGTVKLEITSDVGLLKLAPVF